MKVKIEKRKAYLENRLAEVKSILSNAERTQGKSLFNIDNWNDYHDEQSDIESELWDIEIDKTQTTEHYSR